MRISTGRYKARELEYPRAGLRPTKNMTRQAMFNMLGTWIRGAHVCDLYAGAGSLGIEALSRGAASAVFIEQNALILRFLRHNLKDLKGVTVIRGDVLKVLKRLKGMGINLVIADPPYLNRLVQATIDKVAELGLLEPGGLLVVEHHRLEMPVPPAGWEAVKQGNYGESMVTILRRGK